MAPESQDGDGLARSATPGFPTEIPRPGHPER